jgi:hypothetical protein
MDDMNAIDCQTFRGPHLNFDRRKGWFSWAAFGWAYLIILQTLGVGLCIRAHTRTYEADIICSSSGAAGRPDLPRRDYQHDRDCCPIGCAFCGFAVASPVDFMGFDGLAWKLSASLLPTPIGRLISKFEPTLYRARGPPRVV